ncbi:hypothetical protein WG906_09985 [Pedobacter sp. P351]|uniref:hypothetical protein n=1 Tax=Pedobacter superstes TaxID=3133441 RepID=UPI003097C597
MKPITLKHFFILLAVTFAISCKKGDSPETEKITNGHGNISYFAKALVTGVKTSALKSNTILSTVSVDWSSASIYVEKISFVGKSSNLLDTTIVIEKNMNIFNLDAMAGVIKLPSGSYKDVKVKLFLKKSPKSALAFNLRGTFMNTKGTKDSLIVASSLPFEANLGVNDITLNPSDNYKVTVTFDLNKVLTDISASLIETVNTNLGTNGLRTYVIWKGGSQDVPLFNKVTTNWQTVSSVVISK